MLSSLCQCHILVDKLCSWCLDLNESSKQVEQSVKRSRLWRHPLQLAEGSYLLSVHTISPLVWHDSIWELFKRVSGYSLDHRNHFDKPLWNSWSCEICCGIQWIWSPLWSLPQVGGCPDWSTDCLLCWGAHSPLLLWRTVLFPVSMNTQIRCLHTFSNSKHTLCVCTSELQYCVCLFVCWFMCLALISSLGSQYSSRWILIDSMTTHYSKLNHLIYCTKVLPKRKSWAMQHTHCKLDICPRLARYWSCKLHLYLRTDKPFTEDLLQLQKCDSQGEAKLFRRWELKVWLKTAVP